MTDYLTEDHVDLLDLIADVEEELRRLSASARDKAPYLDERFLKELKELRLSGSGALQGYVEELLEARGPKRKSGKVDTVCFYDSCAISAATWSNFMSGTYTKATILKIAVGLECDMEETNRLLMLAGFGFTGSFMDNIIKAAILSGHNNRHEMYTILKYYSGQYPDRVKNIYE